MAGSDQGRELSPPGRDEVHAAWLAAGANGDTVVMKQLRSRFPEWLDLQWVRKARCAHGEDER